MSSLSISNKEFIHALVEPAKFLGMTDHEPTIWVCHYAHEPRWGGQDYNSTVDMELPAENTYFCVSLLKDVGGTVTPAEDKLMQAMDTINRDWGRNTVSLASSGIKPAWSLRANFHSPRYTTRWEELFTASAK